MYTIEVQSLCRDYTRTGSPCSRVQVSERLIREQKAISSDAAKNISAAIKILNLTHDAFHRKLNEILQKRESSLGSSKLLEMKISILKMSCFVGLI